MPPAAALVAVVVGALLVVLAGARAAPARADDPPPTRAQLTVTALEGVLGPGTRDVADDVLDPEELEPPQLDLDVRLLVENTGDVALRPLQVVIEVHPAVADRAALHRALEGDLATTALHIHRLDARDGRSIGVGDVVGIADTFTPDEVDWPASDGVHPVRIAVVLGTTILDEVITSVVWLDQVPDAGLLTTMVWPIDAPPWRTVGGAYPASVSGSVEPGGRLDVLVRALERRPNAPVAIAPAVHLVEDLQDRADGFSALDRQDDGSLETRIVEPEAGEATASNDLLQRIRQVTSTLPFDPVVGAYADADLVALTGSGEVLSALAGEAAVASRVRGRLLLERRMDGATHLAPWSLDPATADLIPGSQLLLPASAVAPDPASPAGDAARVVWPVRTPAGRLLTAMVGDPFLAAAMSASSPGGPLLQLQRIVAESAVTYLEAPDDGRRALLVLPPPTWDPAPEVAAGLVGTVVGLPWIEPVDATTLATLARRSFEALELAPPETTRLEPSVLDELPAALQELEAVATALPAAAPTEGRRATSELRDQLLRSTSWWFRGEAVDEAEALIRDVRSEVDTIFGAVEVSDGTQVTLTSDEGEIPITVSRTRGGPITVQVEVESQGRLLWTEGRRSEPVVLDEGTSQTLSFPTRALSTGTFPMTVRVTDPTGTVQLARGSLSVRSTTVSGPALSLIGGLVVALLLAGSLRARGPRRPHLEPVRSVPDATDGDDDDHPGPRRRIV